MTPQEEQREREDVELLAGMMGGGVGLDEALRVLRKHKGDLQKAADAMLNGDRGEEDISSQWLNSSPSTQVTAYDPSSSGVSQATQASSSTLIDLTSEEHDARTWQLEPSQNEAKFGPSERPPDPAWQMVTTNTPVDPNHDERSLNDAIQASLADFNTDELELFPVEQTVREGGRPIALRTESPGIAYAALTIQALCHVPQVRESMAKLRLPDIDIDLPPNEHAMWNLVELFTNLDLAQLSSIIDKDVLPSLGPLPWDGSTYSSGDLTNEFIKCFGDLIEFHINAQNPEEAPESRLFTFVHGQAESRGSSFKLEKNGNKGYVVVVDVGDTFAPNDLISRLSVNLSRYTGNASFHDVIIDPSDLAMFQLKPSVNRTNSAFPSGPTSTRSLPKPFVFPKHLYLDRFLLENLPLANEKRVLEREMIAEISELTKRKEFLTNFDKRDNLKDLRASLHYYEHVAESKGDPERQAALQRTAQKLKNILETNLAHVDEIDRRIEKLQGDISRIFDCPELQKHQYDLRCVLMHTGLPGRKQIYSYVQDKEGVWWKTVDYSVTEVPEETVLTDPTGLHLGAGPYLLLYSRHLSEEQLKAPVVWPKAFADRVETANRTLFSLLQSEPEKASVVPVAAGSSMTSLSFPFKQAALVDRTPSREDSLSMDVSGD